MTRRDRRAAERAYDRDFNRAVNAGTLELGIGPSIDALEVQAERLTATETFRRAMTRTFKGVTRA